MIHVAAFFFALGGFLNACMDRSRDGGHSGSWLFEQMWVIRFNRPAEEFILGIVPKDFWHLAKWLMWLSFGEAFACVLISFGVPFWTAQAYGVVPMLAQGAVFLFFYHAGLYRDPIRRLWGFAWRAIARCKAWIQKHFDEPEQVD